jgi:hypothetical protein
MSKHVDWAGIDWNDVYRRALLFAAYKMGRLKWRGQAFGAIPAGKGPEDIVHDAIMKTISGQRAWNPEITLSVHLAGVISSEINHLAMTAENRKSLEAADDKIVLFPDTREDPETVAIRQSQEQHFFTYLGKKKPALRQLAELILQSREGTSGLKKKLNLDDRELSSLKRALRRATEEFLEEEHALEKAKALTEQPSNPAE